jgi:hypothetical protein
MGKILTMKTHEDDKVHLTLELTPSEVLKLQGNLDQMHLFSENSLDCETRLVQRGRRESTKYFLLPKEYRKGILPSTQVRCTRLDTQRTHVFIFSVARFTPSRFVSSEL